MFDNLFVDPPKAVNAYLSEPTYLEDLKHTPSQQAEQIEQIVSYLVRNKPLTLEECISWARLQFEDKFHNEIAQLLHSLPKDHVTSEGQLFWSGPKRAPDPLIFNPDEVRIISNVNVPMDSDFKAADSSRIYHRCCKPSCVQLRVEGRD